VSRPITGSVVGGHGPHEGARAAQPKRATGWLTPVNVLIIIATLLALVVRGYRMTRPGYLMAVHEYDDGPYFGSAVSLVHGVLPYRDFIFVQPPGITLLMSPAALLARLTGTASGLAVGRILTAVASTAGVALAGLLVRHRGLLAVAVTCGIIAVFPASVAAAHTVLVEPWLVMFCLIGALAMFDGDRLATSNRRLIWGGVAFGFAGAIELWAIVPVLVIFALCLPRIRRAGMFTAGVAAGFLVPVLPFAALAPRQFYRGLIIAQIGNRPGSIRVPIWFRLQDMTGLAYSGSAGHLAIFFMVVIIVGLIGGALTATYLITQHAPPLLDRFAVLTAALVVAMLMVPPQFHYHFSAFLAPFLALAIGLTAAGLVAATRPAGSVAIASGRHGWLIVSLACLIIAILGGFQVAGQVARSGRAEGAASVLVARAIPPGPCVLTDQVTYLLISNRFASDVPGCPEILDGTGADLELSHGRTPQSGAGRNHAVATFWRDAFAHARYVLLSAKNSHRIAWSPGLRTYFHNNFSRVLKSRHFRVFVRTGPAGTGSPPGGRVPA
jgi:hypothetical protein